MFRRFGVVSSIRWRVAVAALCAVFAGACSDDSSKHETVPVLRLIDVPPAAVAGFEHLLSDATIGDPAHLRDETPKPAPLLDETIDALPPTFAVRVNAPYVGELYGDQLKADAHPTTPASVVVMYLEHKATDLRLVLQPAPGEMPHVFVYNAKEQLYPADLGGPAKVESILRQAKQYVQWLGVDASAKSMSLSVTMDADAKGVMVGVVNGPHSRLSVTIEPALAAFIQRNAMPRHPPYALRIRSMNDWREAIALPRGGLIRFEVDVPKHVATFSFGFVRSHLIDEKSLKGRVRIWNNDHSVVSDVVVPPRPLAWIERSLDIEAFAGTKASVEFHVDGAASEASSQLLCFSNPTFVPRADQSGRPDVVLVSLDTVRWDRLTLADPALRTSPALAAFAAGGMVFDSAFSAASWTLPSHATVFTGMYPDRTGMSFLYSSIPTECSTIAEEFRAAGYETIAVTGGGYVMPEFGFARGFERYVACDPAYPDPQYVEERHDVAELVLRAANTQASRKDLLDRLRAPRTRPLFVFVHTYAAHNYAASSRVLRDLGAADEDIPNLLRGVSTTHLSRYVQQTPTPPDVQQFMARARFLYDCGVREADQLVGDLAATLTDSGRLDKTFVLTFSDHGEELFERGGIGHGRFLYEEFLHVPLVLLGPGIAPGRSHELVSLIDVLPTLRELAGIAPLASGAPIDGRSLVPILRGEHLPDRPIYARVNHLDTVRRAMRSATEKFILSDEPGMTIQRELFDLRADPHELANRVTVDPGAAAPFDERLARFVETLERTTLAGDKASMSADTQKQLEELGYLGGK